MIATRRRKNTPKYGRFVLPLVAIAALVAALMWPPSHNVIANGPLKPAFTVAATVGGGLAKPFSFASQQQAIADRNRDLRRLNAKLETDRQTEDQKDQRIAALRSQISQLQAEPKATAVPLPKPQASTLGLDAGLAGPTVPDDVKRTAAYWASMDAEKAAAIVQRLPDTYVNQVFAQMSPDTVGDIMNSLPPKVAARLVAAASTVANGK